MIDVDQVLARNLRAAIVSGQVEPFFQPIVSLDDGRIMGFEVLARWQRPGHGFVSPARFIPIAERIGLLDDLLNQLMRAAFGAAERWPHNLFLSFNVSPTQLRDQELAARVSGAAMDWSFPLSRVHIEITETGFIDDLAKQRRTLDRLINLGCVVAMDDFGTGCSSLSWLNTLPFSALKVDASFVMAMEEHRNSQKIVAAVVGLGHSLGLAVVAEGVETPGQADLLRGMGCQFAQGYLFGRPMPACAVPDLLLGSPVAVANDDCAVPVSLALRAQRLSAGYPADAAVAFMDPTGVVVASSQAFDKAMHVAGDAVGQHIGDLIGVSTAQLAELRATDLLDEMFPAFEESDADGSVGNIHIRRVEDESCDLAGYSVEFDYAADPAYFQTSRSSTPLL